MVNRESYQCLFEKSGLHAEHMMKIQLDPFFERIDRWCDFWSKILILILLLGLSSSNQQWELTATSKNCIARNKAMCWDTCCVSVAGNTVSSRDFIVLHVPHVRTRPVAWDTVQSKVSSSTVSAFVAEAAKGQCTRVAHTESPRAMASTNWSHTETCSPLLRWAFILILWQSSCAFHDENEL